MNYIVNKIITSLIFLLVLVLGALSSQAKVFTLVIDAGHGGKDYGAIGLSANEKDINLSVALLFGKMVENQCKNVNVVYTRKTDTFIPLQSRADKANKSGGDLFISIHTNSVDAKTKNRTSVYGASTYTLGIHRTKENLAVAKRENAVIVLENEYTSRYKGFDPSSSESYIIFELNQNIHMEQSINFASKIQKEFVSTAHRKDNGVRQAGLLVLAQTSMPAVLVELDFICNPTQERYLKSQAGQRELATALFNAFSKYKSNYDKNYTASHAIGKPNAKTDADNAGKATATIKSPSSKAKSNRQEKERNSNPKMAEADGIEYRIQFLTSNKKLKSKDTKFKGLSPTDYYQENGLYKYTFGTANNKKEALSLLKKVKAKFPNAFIVEFKNNKRVKSQ